MSNQRSQPDLLITKPVEELPSREDLERIKLAGEVDLIRSHSRPERRWRVAEPVMNLVAVGLGAGIALTGNYLLRPRPSAPPPQATAALRSWQLQTNPIRQSLVDFSEAWPSELAAHLDCEVRDLPGLDEDQIRAAKDYYDRRTTAYVNSWQEELQSEFQVSPQHVGVQMRIWFGDVDLTDSDGTTVKLREYLAQGEGKKLYMDVRLAIHEATLRGADATSDQAARRAMSAYLSRRIRVSEAVNSVLADWYSNPPRAWPYSQPAATETAAGPATDSAADAETDATLGPASDQR